MEPARERRTTRRLTLVAPLLTPARIYVACPVTTYGTPPKASALARLAEAFPGAEVVDPARLYASDADWLSTWPSVLGGLDALVVVPAPDRSIGAGVLREVADALAYHLPVATFMRRRLSELARLVVLPPGERRPARCALVEAGRRLAPSALLPDPHEEVPSCPA